MRAVTTNWTKVIRRPLSGSHLMIDSKANTLEQQPPNMRLKMPSQLMKKGRYMSFITDGVARVPEASSSFSDILGFRIGAALICPAVSALEIGVVERLERPW